jgi:hypothetical protein
LAPSETLAVILRPAPPPPPSPVERLAARLARRRRQRARLALLAPEAALLPSLYCLLPLDAILGVLRQTATASARLRRLPAHEVVWLLVAASLFRGRSLPMVWRHTHPSCDAAQPVDSAFTQARQRLGALPLKLIFHRTCRPLGGLGLRHGPWLVVALDGSVFEAPDTPANRAAMGCAGNQHGTGAFPQLRLAALCEAGTHAITDVEIGPYGTGEQELGLRLLRRLPKGRLVLMDRGLSYYGQVAAVRRRKSHALARVKVSRGLPVERRLADGSYLSTIYPSYNARRAGREGIVVRVIRYTHDDPCRAGRGEEAVLITTVLSVAALSALAAVRLYPWRWEEESALAEVKETLLQDKAPLLRSKEPGLAVQEVYGLLIGHYLVRQQMAQSARQAGTLAVRLSFKRSLEVLEDRMKDPAPEGWLGGLRRELGRQKLRPRRPRRYPRVKKATRSRWPNKKPGSKPPPQPKKPFSEVVRLC